MLRSNCLPGHRSAASGVQLSKNMKLRSLLLAFVFAFMSSCLFAQSAPVGRVEILGRLALGYSPSYIAHLIKTRGLSFSPTADFLDRVKLAGGEGILFERLSSAGVTSSSTSGDQDGPVEHLGKCAALSHSGALESATKECRGSIDENPKSPWPLLATARALYLDRLWRKPPRVVTKRDPEEAELLLRAAALVPNLPAVQQAVASTATSSDDESELQKLASVDPDDEDDGEAPGWSDIPEMPTFVGGPSQDAGPPAFASEEDTAAPGPASDEDTAETTPAPDGPSSIEAQLIGRVKEEPELASIHVALANQYAETHNLEKAESELREAIRLEPDNPPPHSALAALFSANGKDDAALTELHEGVRIVPFGDSQHMAFAAGLEFVGRTQEAVAELKTLLASHPADVAPSDALVELYEKHKERKPAISELRRSLNASSSHFADQAEFVKSRFEDENNLANLLKEDRQYSAAAEQYLFLLGFMPDNGGLHNDYANVLLAQHKLDAAIDEYNQSLRLNPDSSAAHNNIGLCLAQKKDLDGAIAEFARSLELSPNVPGTEISLGTALGQKGDLNGAMGQFQQAIEQNPKDPETQMGVAFALSQLKDASGAIAHLKRALELQPDYPTAENNLAWIYCTADDARLRNPSEALVLARRAVETSPSPNPSFLDTLAEAQFMNGQRTEAVASEKQALKLDPENAGYKMLLSQFQEGAKPAAASGP